MRLPKLKIRSQYIYPGETAQLTGELKELKDQRWYHGSYIVDMQTDWEYDIYSKFSFGGISSLLMIRCKLQVVDKYKVKENPKILISTNIRFEHYVFLAFFAFVQIVATESVAMFFAFIAIQIMVHLWFGWIYRLQEVGLIKKVQTDFGLKKVNES